MRRSSMQHERKAPSSLFLKTMPFFRSLASSLQQYLMRVAECIVIIMFNSLLLLLTNYDIHKIIGNI